MNETGITWTRSDEWIIICRVRAACEGSDDGKRKGVSFAGEGRVLECAHLVDTLLFRLAWAERFRRPNEARCGSSPTLSRSAFRISGQLAAT